VDCTRFAFRREGPERGTSTPLDGTSKGSGKKSTIAVQYCRGGSRCAGGDHAVIFAFDERHGDLGGAGSEALGIRFKEEEGKEAKSGYIRSNPAELSPGRIRGTWCDKPVVEGQGPQSSSSTSLNGYMNAMPEERFLTAQLHEPG